MNVSEANFSSYDKQEINIEGIIHNVATTSYSYQAGPEAESIIGDISKNILLQAQSIQMGINIYHQLRMNLEILQSMSMIM